MVTSASHLQDKMCMEFKTPKLNFEMSSSNKGLWGAMVALNQVVQKALLIGASQSGTPEALEAAHDLDVVLQRNRSAFITLLRNPPINITERTSLQKSITEPVVFPRFAMPTKLPENFVREVLIISDMFNLNEMASLSLLRSAEEEKTLYPGLPRGLIGVLLYYDSRECLANAFKSLVQARQGISWTLLPNNDELSSSITQYLSPLLNLSLLDHLLELITSMDVTKEVELLQQNRALGDAKHKKMVLDKFKSIRNLVAETLFCWAAQSPLKKDECKRLISHLSGVTLTETGDGSLDSVNLALLMALLYSLEAGHLLSFEDVTEAFSQFPITADSTFVPELHMELRADHSWSSKELQAVVQFAWSISLANLREVSSNTHFSDFDKYTEDDEYFVNEAVKNKIFQFIERSVLTKRNIPFDQFYGKRLHEIFSNFIYHMPEKIKFLKNKADENARLIMANLREGLQAPTYLDHSYEEMLTAMASLYKEKECSEFIEEYWCENASGLPKSYGSKQMSLYKFIRLPGDFLPPSLFVPYVTLLTSMSSTPTAAKQVYSFLKGNSQPPSIGGNLSWDHFLNALSQYYNNLKVEQPVTGIDTIYRSTHSGPKGITPQEIQGLVAVLQLIYEVIELDEGARISLSENSVLSPILVCAGLLTCSVPLIIKSHLLKVLAAFSLSPTLAVKVWHAVEGAGLVPLQSGIPGYSSKGIRQDIEEVESSSEEFPLSKALVRLLTSLVQSGIPLLYSSGRGTGFRGYCILVQSAIFLPHDTRSYRNASEKWEIAKECLYFFNTLLNDYTSAKMTTKDSVSHPGHFFLLDLMYDSHVIHQLLSIFHDGIHILEKFIDAPGKEDMNETLLLILDVILKGLELQKSTLSMETKGDLLLLGLDRLLQSVNSRSGACDHLLNISKLLGHHASLPLHAAKACRLLTIVGASPSGQTHILPLLTSPPSVGTTFRQNFVQLLDHATLDDDHNVAADAAVELLKKYLSLPPPNLAHFLLGFLDSSTVSTGELRSDLLEPGIRGFPRTALHSLLTVLPTLPAGLTEKTYQLIYILTCHPATFAATLRYLSSHEFVYKSLLSLPVNLNDIPKQLLATGWILQIASLDLRYHASHQQRSQLRRLIHLLVSGPEESDAVAELSEGTAMPWGASGSGPSLSHRGILLYLLDSTDLTLDSPPPLESQLVSFAPELTKSCEEAKGDIKEINIQLFHQLICHLLQKSSSTTPIAHKDQINEEIQEVLDYAVAINHSRKLLSSQKHFFTSWKELVEVTLAVTPADVIETSFYISFLHALTLELSRRLLDEGALPELTSILVSTLLSLVTTLRTVYAQPTVKRSLHYVPSLDGAAAYQLPSSLQLVLKGLIDCVIKFRHSSQSVRASVYASLLNYLHIHVAHPPEISQPVQFSVVQRETQDEQFHRENFEAVRDDLSHLIEILCCEASAGHYVCKVLALTCIDGLAGLEKRAAPFSTSLSTEMTLLCHLVDQGHLKRILEAIQQDDKLLVSLLLKGSGDLRPLYVWEARSSLISRLALAPLGARLMLQSGLISRLCELQILQIFPESSHDASNYSASLDASSQIYNSVLTGILKICMAVITSLGPQDNSASSQILQLLASHAEAISNALCIPSVPAPQILDQIATLTGVLAVAAVPAAKPDPNNPSALQAAAQTRRLHKHLLLLLPHFLPQSALGKAIETLPDVNDDGVCIKEAARTASLKVLSHCLGHAKDQLLKDSPLGRETVLLFHPTFEVASISDTFPSMRSLTLGTLISILDETSHVFSNSLDLQKKLTSRLKELDTTPHDSLLKYVGSSLALSASPAAVKHLAAAHLQLLLDHYKMQEELGAHIVEYSAYLLWRHLQYFLVFSPRVDLVPDKENRFSLIAVPRAITAAQAKELKSKASASVTEILPHLQQVHDLYYMSTSHVSFLSSSLLRIRKLVL